jgi:NADPH:quinone reductase-like Zn-dependent oxidoreductase
VLAHFKNLRFLGSPREKRMSNRAVKVQSFDAKDPFAGLALVTKPVPKAEAGHVVIQITLRPILPFDLMCIHQGANGLFTPGAEGFGIVHDIRISILLPSFHAH